MDKRPKSLCGIIHRATAATPLRNVTVDSRDVVSRFQEDGNVDPIGDIHSDTIGDITVTSPISALLNGDIYSDISA